MLIDHYIFFLIFIVPLGLIFYKDRKNIRIYAALGGVTLIFAFIFESLSVLLGWWEYLTEPRIFLASVYTWGGYFYYIIFCYFLGSRVLRRKEK